MTTQTTAARPETRAIPFIYSENAKAPPWYGLANPHTCADLELRTPQGGTRLWTMKVRIK
jgi:hypothetical protein